MTDIRVGDEVKLTFSGEATRVGGDVVTLKGGDGCNRLFVSSIYDVEVTKRAEPEYVQGAYYMGDDGVLYQHDTWGWPGWFKWGGERVDFDTPKRPLRRMRPEALPADQVSL